MTRRTKAGRRAALRAWALVLDPAARAAVDGLRRAVAPLVERAAGGTRETIRLDALLDGLGPCARDLVTRAHLALAMDTAVRGTGVRWDVEVASGRGSWAVLVFDGAAKAAGGGR